MFPCQWGNFPALNEMLQNTFPPAKLWTPSCFIYLTVLRTVKHAVSHCNISPFFFKVCPEYLQLLSAPDVSECQREALLAGSDLQNVISSKASVLFAVEAVPENNHLLGSPPLPHQPPPPKKMVAKVRIYCS